MLTFTETKLDDGFVEDMSAQSRLRALRAQNANPSTRRTHQCEYNGVPWPGSKTCAHCGGWLQLLPMFVKAFDPASELASLCTENDRAQVDRVAYLQGLEDEMARMAKMDEWFGRPRPTETEQEWETDRQAWVRRATELQRLARFT